jgi:transposase
MLIGYSGDIGRFRNRDRYAAYNGTAPVEFSSGGRVVHRVSKRGNRQLNHAIHMAAICQLRQAHSDGRAYFDRRVAKGKPPERPCGRRNTTSATPSTASSSLTLDAPTASGPGRTNGNDSKPA